MIGQRIAIHAALRQPVSLYDADVIADHRGDGSWWLRTLTEDHPMPLGAVVTTGRLVACVQVLKVRPDGTWTIVQRDHTGPVRGVVLDQLPYGDFTPGRWAWLLDDIEQLDKPLPATGRQGMWDIYI